MDRISGFNLQITMPELVDSAIEGLKFYDVVLWGSDGDPLAKRYTYKTLLNFDSRLSDGEQVKVLVPTEDTFSIATVVKACDFPSNYKRPPEYKWIVCEVDFSQYDNCVKSELDVAKDLQSKIRRNATRNAFNSLLGSDFKPVNLLGEGGDGSADNGQ